MKVALHMQILIFAAFVCCTSFHLEAGPFGQSCIELFQRLTRHSHTVVPSQAPLSIENAQETPFESRWIRATTQLSEDLWHSGTYDQKAIELAKNTDRLNEYFNSMQEKSAMSVFEVAEMQALSRAVFQRLVQDELYEVQNESRILSDFESAIETKEFLNLREKDRGLERAFFEIRHLLASEVCFPFFQELELEVLALSVQKNMDRFSALEEVLASWESRAGFGPVIDLEARRYSHSEWYQMLSQGRLFRDRGFEDKSDFRKGHGRDTHRIQWNIVIRYMLKHPDVFPEKPAYYFRSIGINKKLSPESKVGLWFILVDHNSKNFGRPETLLFYHGLFPGLGFWR